MYQIYFVDDLTYSYPNCCRVNFISCYFARWKRSQRLIGILFSPVEIISVFILGKEITAYGRKKAGRPNRQLGRGWRCCAIFLPHCVEIPRRKISWIDKGEEERLKSICSFLSAMGPAALRRLRFHPETRETAVTFNSSFRSSSPAPSRSILATNTRT